MREMILTIDQGTTSTRAVLFGHDGQIGQIEREEIQCTFPEPGWVEQDPEEIIASVLAVCGRILKDPNNKDVKIRAIGITNQRETSICWERKSGRALGPAIVWQSRQTAGYCDQLEEAGHRKLLHEKTGLFIDPYFSGTKFAYLLDHIEDGHSLAETGEICLGTVDTWILYRLTGGNTFATDVSNASRTQLCNIHTLEWDEELLDIFNVPKIALPEIKSSADDYGTTDPFLFYGHAIPICGVAGDQQAALFGQQCLHKGDVKNTYGTGCFLLLQTGEEPVFSEEGILTTVAWRMGNVVNYALEGSVFVGGAAVQWLRDSLGVIASAAESETIARTVDDTDGVVFVPAFVGLGAPYWEDAATGLLTGLTKGSTKAHIVRAVLESIAMQSAEVIESMEKSSGISPKEILADGGAAANDLLMEMQADLMGCSVVRGLDVEQTARGAAYFAGLHSDFWKHEDLITFKREGAVFEPEMSEQKRQEKKRMWNRAIRQVLCAIKD